MDGYEVVYQLREDESLPFIPVFLVTADRYTSWREAIAAGANGVIHKPIDINELLSEVEQTLNNKSDPSAIN